MVYINSTLLDFLSEQAKRSARKRKNHNFHNCPSDTLQRMLNALEPETYIRPHKHEHPPKREAFIILRGKMVIIEFDEAGLVTGHLVADAGNGAFGAEVQAGVYHCIICLEPSTVYYELKDGPYDVSNDKVFAPWSPPEGDVGARSFINSLKIKLGLQA